MANWNINNDTIRANDYMLFIAQVPQSGDPSYKVLGFGKSNGISLSQDTAESSSKFSCAWKANQATRIGYQVTADSLYTTNTDATSFDDLVAYMVAGDNIAWALGKVADWNGECSSNPFVMSTDANDHYYNGIGLITSLDLNAEEDSVVSMSITIDGSGEILKDGSPITIGTH